MIFFHFLNPPCGGGTYVGLELLEAVDEVGIDVVCRLLLARGQGELDPRVVVGHNVQVPEGW